MHDRAELDRVEAYTLNLGELELEALDYIVTQLRRGKEYLSLTLMAKETGLRYDQCETFTAKFFADRIVKRVPIVEDGEG